MRLEKKLVNKIVAIDKRYYVTLVSALVFGLLAHLYQFTNKIFNYDELGQTPAGFGAGISLGRWGLQLVGDSVGHFFRNYSLPMINGMITLLFVVLSACIIVRVFDIKDKVCCALIGGIIAVFPALTATYFFMFTAPYYGFAFFLACIAGMLLINAFKVSEKKSNNIINCILGIALLILATAIYQSYCAVTLCMLLIYVVVEFYEGNVEWFFLLKRGIIYCTTFVIAIVLYVLGTKISVAITGIQLDGYRGIDSMEIAGIGGIIRAIYYCYRNYIMLMSPKDVYQMNPIRFVSFIFVIINTINVIFFVKRVTLKEVLMSKIGYILTIALLPMAMFFPEILLQGEGGVYAIMTYSSVFVFIFPIVIYEKYANKTYGQLALADTDGKAVRNDLIGSILSVVIFASILVYIWFANGNYQAMQYTAYHDLAYFETLATQVKSLDGYEPDMPVAFVGTGFDDPTFRAGGLMGDYFDIEGKWDTNINYFNNIYLWTSYLGYTPEIIEFKDSAYLLENEAIRNMPSYPSSGSIRIVDGVVIIRGINN